MERYSRKEAIRDLEASLLYALKQRVKTQQALQETIDALTERYPDSGQRRIERKRDRLGFAIDDALADHLRWDRDVKAYSEAIMALAECQQLGL